MSSPSTSRSNKLNYDPHGSHLTPRTPRSRAGKPATSFDNSDARHTNANDAEEDLDEVDLLYAQSYPLLRSSASATFPPPATQQPRRPPPPRHSKRLDPQSSIAKFKQFMDIVPLALGAVGAMGLLVLILLSVHQPQVLQRYILKNATTTEDKSHTDMAQVAIDYSNHTTFPLEGYEYEQECVNLMEGHPMSHGEYWTPMRGAEGLDVPHQHELGEGGVCSSTITYMLDGTVGLFYDLGIIAQAAAFARERNRTFIIDDTRWNRGKWTDHFMDVRETQSGPEPGCRAPPANELVACPRTARHWVLTQRTAKFHLGHDFSEQFEDPYKSDINRYRPIYNHAFESFRDTILPSTALRKELTKLRQQQAKRPYIGMHIRHGDRFPQNQKWRQDFVPLSEYTRETSRIWDQLKSSNPPEVQESQPTVYVATDSYAAFQDHLSLSPAPENVWSMHISDNHSWKWMANPHGYVQRIFSGGKTRPEERKRWTQGVILDFAMISGAWLQPGERGPLATLCTLTSNICKMAAVGLGWERAFEKAMWVDLDWQGLVWPPWDAFEFH